MYKIKLWDEDKWNIHSGSYNSSKYSGASHDEKKDDGKYHGQKYGQKDKNASSDYMKREDTKEKEENKAEIFDELEEKKGQEIKEDEIPFKATKQVFNGGKYEAKKAGSKKEIKTIEDAIKKAIEEEKKGVIVDD